MSRFETRCEEPAASADAEKLSDCKLNDPAHPLQMHWRRRSQSSALLMLTPRACDSTAPLLRHPHANGFTLMDLMLTIVIIGLVTTMAVVQVGHAQATLKGDGGMRVIVAAFGRQQPVDFGAVETITYPGRDEVMGTPDDEIVVLNLFHIPTFA
jgi:hypothetical protein